MVNAKRKGNAGEREFITKWCDLTGIDKTWNHKRNTQATAYGGFHNADVNIPELSDIHIEVKNTKNASLPSWIEKNNEDCPPSKCPIIAWKKERDGWYWILKMEHLEKISVQVVEAFGWNVSPKESE